MSEGHDLATPKAKVSRSVRAHINQPKSLEGLWATSPRPGDQRGTTFAVQHVHRISPELQRDLLRQLAGRVCHGVAQEARGGLLLPGTLLLQLLLLELLGALLPRRVQLVMPVSIMSPPTSSFSSSMSVCPSGATWVIFLLPCPTSLAAAAVEGSAAGGHTAGAATAMRATVFGS